jgi:hypothetical protein
MAETPQGDYYYEAGTINEQLEDYSVFEEDGRLYLAEDATGNAVSNLGYHLFLNNFRSEGDGQLTDSVVDEDETALYARDSGSDIILEAAHNDPTDGMVYATVATFTGAGDDDT